MVSLAVASSRVRWVSRSPWANSKLPITNPISVGNNRMNVLMPAPRQTR